VWSQDYREIVGRPDIDVVFVCTPTAFHSEVVIEAARHGKELFCEKPLALTLADGEKMVRAVREAGVRMGINFCHRFWKANHFLRRYFQEGKAGRPIYHTMYMAAKVRPNITMHDDRLNRGPVMDVLCHFLDTWRFLFGSEPCRVFARAATFAKGKAHVATVKSLALDTAVVTVEFESGDVGCFHVCWGLPEDTASYGRNIAVGPEALIELDGFRKITITRGKAEPEVIDDLHTDIHLEQMNHFATALKTNGPPNSTGEDGLIALKVSLAAFESVRTGEAVLVKA